MSSELNVYLDQMVLVHFGHRIHDGGIQWVLGIVGQHVGLIFDDTLDIVVQEMQIKRARGSLVGAGVTWLWTFSTNIFDSGYHQRLDSQVYPMI